MKKMIKRQTTFNRLALFLLIQNRKSLIDDGGCAYRGNDGLRCPGGELIPNCHYSPDFEEEDVKSLVRKHKEIVCKFPKNKIRDFFGHDAELVQKFQNIHDFSSAMLQLLFFVFPLNHIVHFFSMHGDI